MSERRICIFLNLFIYFFIYFYFFICLSSQQNSYSLQEFLCCFFSFSGNNHCVNNTICYFFGDLLYVIWEI